jgi:glycosyltransferase involved in cell wall biosynthesis
MPSSNPAILFLTSWYPVKENPVHGIFIRGHAEALSKYTKVVVAYAYSSKNGPFYEVEETKVNDNFVEYRVRYPKPEHRIFGITPFTQTIKFKKAYKLLLSKLIEKKIEVNAIQVNIVFPVAIALPVFKNYYKVKHTIAENWSGYLASDGNYRGTAMKHYTKQCFESADKIWHVSQLQKEAMIAHGLTGNFELLYNTVNTDVFKPRGISESVATKIKFLHVSSLVEREKNISGTFRAFKKLQDQKVNFELAIIGGNGETISEAKKLVEELGLKNIVFIGSKKPEEIAAYMQQSNALILFSHFEGMPLVVLEAMSCGLPVLATKVGQLPHIITDKFGVLVDVDNEDQMFEALLNLSKFKYKFEPQATRDFIMRHASQEAVGKQFYDYYSKLN